ncbi:NUDIX hydrolase [Microbacterium sp. P04]|uniref:NUDIX hydrolase n=1 Tax=Microbacterium sp. P04 TaxID=3366947 RepID=UPI003745446D
MPSGIEIEPYYVLDYHDWVSVFALDQESNVILIREYHHGPAVTGVGLPGGTLNSPDEDPSDGAMRELAEETGYVAHELIDLGPVWANWSNHTNRVHNFLALGCTASGTQNLDISEGVSLELTPFDKVSTQMFGQSYHRLNAYMAFEWIDRHQRSGLARTNEVQSSDGGL